MHACEMHAYKIPVQK